MSEKRELPSGGGLIGVAIRQPVFTTMLMVGLVVLGLFSFRRLSIDQYPDVSIPVVSVQTTYPGSSPEVVEREVTKRIEEAVNPIRGVDKLSSISLEGVSSITVEFELGTNIDSATAELRSKIEEIRRDLPAAIDPPVVQQFDPAALPILSLALVSERLPVGELTALADEDIRRVLEGVDGVGRVQVTGGLEREIHVLLDTRAMQAREVGVEQIRDALRQQNLEVPAGRIELNQREELVRVFGRIERPEQFGGIIVVDRGGDPVRLDQVAKIIDSTEEARDIALVNGQRAVGIDILKVVGGNTVDVADGIEKALPGLRAALPAGVDLSVVRDNSVEIRKSVESVQEELLLGAAMTVLIVLFFLGDLRATIITSLALPVSVISTFILFDALGFTLNILTLMALALSIGILIDDAIVVIENIVRHREQGKDFVTAAFEATEEIFFAVMATTFAFVAVFVPVAFMGGIIGKFFFEFGLAVAWAVLVSLFVSFTLTPMLAAWWGSSTPKPSAPRTRSLLTRVHGAVIRFLDLLGEGYGRLITWALRHRIVTLGLAAASLIGALALLPLVGGSFMPEQDSGQFTVNFKTPSGSSFNYTVEKLRSVESVIRKLPGVDHTYGTVGSGVTGTVTAGEVYVALLPLSERSASQQQLMQAAREALAGTHNLKLSVLEGGGAGGAQKPLQIIVRGPEPERLQALSEQVLAAVGQVPGVIEAQSSLGEPRPEIRLKVDIDRAHDLGLDASKIAAEVRPLLAGEPATSWEDPSGKEREVVMRLPVAARSSREQLAEVPLTVKRGDDTLVIPLGQVATLSRGTSASEIERRDLARVATISANLAPGRNLSDTSAAITAELGKVTLPEGYTLALGGDAEELAETTGYVLESILLAVILIYLILASQFGRFLQPIAIMVSLPLSLVGVFLALFLTGDTLNIMSMIGVILLMGLVTKNAILLVDLANQLRAEGKSAFEAITSAGTIRLRPILMTAFGTIAGMIPIALGSGEGGGFRAPMARAVIGGMITSTVLTLVVIPAIYTYFESFTDWLAQRPTQKVASRSEARAEGDLETT